MSGIKEILERLSAAHSSCDINALIDFAENKHMDDETVASLARHLAMSGQTISWPDDYNTADVASTGGPSSLSTLLCPLYLRALGAKVPALGVPGRPAGAIDVLAQIPDYKTSLAMEQVKHIISTTGYAHFVADNTFAPLDALVFRARQIRKAQQIPSLVISSLLSKKIAVDVRYVGLDIRVAPHGNFGRILEEARANAKRFIAVAKLTGISCTCFLTDGSMPYQPYIGRGESLVALHQLLSQCGSAQLKMHDDLCFEMARCAIGKKDIERPDITELLECFVQNISAQGSCMENFISQSEKIIQNHTQLIHSKRSGFFRVDLGLLRNLFAKEQKRMITESEPFPDPCGIILQHSVGTWVENGSLLATVRVEEGSDSDFAERVYSCFNFGEKPIPSFHYEEIQNA